MSMASSSSTSISTNTAVEVRIVVAGDIKTGKSSLIHAAVYDAIGPEVPSVMQPTRLPEDMFPDRVPVTAIDTSVLLNEGAVTDNELQRADVVVLTYSYDDVPSFLRLSTFWLPKLRQLGAVKVPVIVAGCMYDIKKMQTFDYEKGISSLMRNFWQVQSWIECSVYERIQISKVFCDAQKAVLHPIGPIIDQKTLTMKPLCVWALKRIFILCDNDRDGALSDAELNDLQVKCFDAPLHPSDIENVKATVVDKCPEGVNENGLTLSGFLHLHELCIENGHPETTWSVLRKFGYNNDLRLGDDQLLPPIKRSPDQASQDMGIEALIRICKKLGDFNNVFTRIVRATENPRLSIPDIEAGKIRNLYHKLLNRSLMVVSVVAAVNIVGLAAYRIFATPRKASSS